MTGGDHVRAELGAYVLGALDPAEADAVREHLARCSECAREHASIAQLPELLSLAEPFESAPPLTPALEERVLDAVALERARSGPRRVRRLFRPRIAIPVAALAAVVAVALVVALGGGSSGRHYQVAFRPVAGSTAGGGAQLKSTADGTQLRLWAKGLPHDANAVYEVLCEARGWTASAGTFRPDAQGRAVVVLTTAARRGEYDSIRVVRRTRASSQDVMTASLN